MITVSVSCMMSCTFPQWLRLSFRGQNSWHFEVPREIRSFLVWCD